jgi:hypothetical protein
MSKNRTSAVFAFESALGTHKQWNSWHKMVNRKEAQCSINAGQRHWQI